MRVLLKYLDVHPIADLIVLVFCSRLFPLVVQAVTKDSQEHVLDSKSG